MQQDERIRTLADRLADVLPEAPRSGVDHLAWCELVWETAGRLSALVDDAHLPMEALADADIVLDGSVDGPALLLLAAVMADRSTAPTHHLVAPRTCAAAGQRSRTRRGWVAARARR